MSSEDPSLRFFNFRLVDCDGAEAISRSARMRGSDNVFNLQEAISDDLVKPLYGTGPGSLQVFQTKEDYDQKKPVSTKRKLHEVDEGTFENPLVIGMAVKRQGTAPWPGHVVRTEAIWTVDEMEYPPLHIGGKDGSVCIPSQYLAGSGLKALGQQTDLFLCKRQGLVDEWCEIQRDAVKHQALLWIVGSPGCGKSCAAYAFACGLLDRTKWTVVWIHFRRRGCVFQCVKFEGNRKSTVTLEAASLLCELNSCANASRAAGRGVFLFFDGCVHEINRLCDLALDVVTNWREVDKEHRRLVCVTSMVTTGRDYKLELLHDIATDKLEPISSETSTDHYRLTPTLCTDSSQDVIKSEMRFQLWSWTIEEYVAAVRDDRLFGSVASVLSLDSIPQETLNEQTSMETRTALIKTKYDVAGGCARYMFTVSSDTMMKTLEAALEAVRNVDEMVKRSVVSDDAEIRLFEFYTAGGANKSRLVSAACARLVATEVGPTVIESFASKFSVDPATDGNLLKMWFLASLVTDGISYKHQRPAQTVGLWRRSPVAYFQPQPMPFKIKDGWNAPEKWHQGGYDAVRWTKADMAASTTCSDTRNRRRLLFVQLMRSKTHDFAEERFIEFLQRLSSTNSENLADDPSAPPVDFVELYIVVPLASLASFKPQIWAYSFKTNVVEVAFPGAAQRVECAVCVVGIKYMK